MSSSRPGAFSDEHQIRARIPDAEHDLPASLAVELAARALTQIRANQLQGLGLRRRPGFRPLPGWLCKQVRAVDDGDGRFVGPRGVSRRIRARREVRLGRRRRVALPLAPRAVATDAGGADLVEESQCWMS